MRFSLALLGLVAGYSNAFQPQTFQQRKTAAVLSSSGSNDEFSRWDMLEKRVSLNNSGPGAPAGRYDVPFTPLGPRGRDYEDTLAYYTSTAPSESRWDDIEKMTSLRNSGPGAPPARYDISFTPLPPVARDYENLAARFANNGRAKESRWDDIDHRRSLGNSGAGAPASNYQITFTPVPPRAREHERIAEYTNGPVESRWSLVENRVSFGNSGPGALPGQYDVTFTPLPPRARDYDDIAAYYASTIGPVESRWDLVEKRTSLSNSGPGALPGNYGVTFTPLPPRANDYEYKSAYYALEAGPIESRWDLVEKRTSLNNSGPGALPGKYDVTFTPLPPRGRDYENTVSYFTAPAETPTETINSVLEPQQEVAMPMPTMSASVLETAQV